MDNIKRIQVVFALDDPYQLQQYNHAYHRKNSSGYLKQLIQMDMLSQNRSVSPSHFPSEPAEDTCGHNVHSQEEEAEEFDFSAGGFI